MAASRVLGDGTSPAANTMNYGTITQVTEEMELPLVLNISSSKPRAHRIINAGQQIHKSSWKVLLWVPLAQASPSPKIQCMKGIGPLCPPLKNRPSTAISWPGHTHILQRRKKPHRATAA